MAENRKTMTKRLLALQLDGVAAKHIERKFRFCGPSFDKSHRGATRLLVVLRLTRQPHGPPIPRHRWWPRVSSTVQSSRIFEPPLVLRTRKLRLGPEAESHDNIEGLHELIFSRGESSWILGRTPEVQQPIIAHVKESKLSEVWLQFDALGRSPRLGPCQYSDHAPDLSVLNLAAASRLVGWIRRERIVHPDPATRVLAVHAGRQRFPTTKGRGTGTWVQQVAARRKSWSGAGSVVSLPVSRCPAPRRSGTTAPLSTSAPADLPRRVEGPFAVRGSNTRSRSPNRVQPAVGELADPPVGDDDLGPLPGRTR